MAIICRRVITCLRNLESSNQNKNPILTQVDHLIYLDCQIILDRTYPYTK